MAEPIIFKRGQTFSCLMRLPVTISDGFFSTWQPKVQLRKARSNTPSGFIADINSYWVDSTNHALLLHHNVTKHWPVGEAELDVQFTAPDGQVVQSATTQISIVQGVTR